MKKYVPYSVYLRGKHFTRQKAIAYYLARKRCLICGKKYSLEAHHLSYKVLGKWYEFLFLRYVCSYHHERVQSFFGKHLTGTVALHLNYFRIKFYYISIFGLYRVLRWLISSYRITGTIRRN